MKFKLWITDYGLRDVAGWLIAVNWALSFIGLSVDTELSPVWAVVVCYVWFGGTTLLMNWANRKGLLDKIVKRFKMDEL